MQPISYFLLALLVFILVVATLILYDRLKRSRNADEGGTIKEKEQRLFKLYQNLEDMILSIEEYVDETKEDLARERDTLRREQEIFYGLLEQQAPFLAAAGKDAAALNRQDVNGAPPGSPLGSPPPVAVFEKTKKNEWKQTTAPSVKEKTPDKANTMETKRKQNTKVEDVRRLCREGLQEEAIAKLLGLSRGEVSLIVGMLND